MGYMIGTVLTGCGIALFRKGGIGFRVSGGVIVLTGVTLLGLSVMVDAKRHDVI